MLSFVADLDSESAELRKGPRKIVGLFTFARLNSLTVWKFEGLMSESQLYTIVLSRNQSTLRFGWISASTGLTYCGICLRAPIKPEIGAACPVCDAHVSQILDVRAAGNSMKQAWQEALPPAGIMSQPQRTEPWELCKTSEMILQEQPPAVVVRRTERNPNSSH